jgi:hypothetical protein
MWTALTNRNWVAYKHRNLVFKNPEAGKAKIKGDSVPEEGSLSDMGSLFCHSHMAEEISNLFGVFGD